MPAKPQCGWLIALEHHAELMPPGSRGANAAQRLDADHILRYVKVQVLGQSNLERVGLPIGIAAVGHKTAFDPFAEVRSAGPDVPALPGLPDDIPKLRTLRSGHQVQLESALLGPTRSRHGDGDPFDLRAFEPEIFQLSNPIAEYRGNHLLGLRPLHGQRRHIGLADFDSEAALG